jgi:hypothetical protein
MTGLTALILDAEETAQLTRLLALRDQLRSEHVRATTPAIARYLELTDVYLFLALTHFGYTGQLFPEQPSPAR